MSIGRGRHYTIRIHHLLLLLRYKVRLQEGVREQSRDLGAFILFLVVSYNDVHLTKLSNELSTRTAWKCEAFFDVCHHYNCVERCVT